MSLKKKGISGSMVCLFASGKEMIGNVFPENNMFCLKKPFLFLKYFIISVSASSRVLLPNES